MQRGSPNSTTRAAAAQRSEDSSDRLSTAAPPSRSTKGTYCTCTTLGAWHYVRCVAWVVENIGMIVFRKREHERRLSTALDAARQSSGSVMQCEAT